jgi:hypothetical protein
MRLPGCRYRDDLCLFDPYGGDITNPEGIR